MEVRLLSSFGKKSLRARIAKEISELMSTKRDAWSTSKILEVSVTPNCNIIGVYDGANLAGVMFYDHENDSLDAFRVCIKAAYTAEETFLFLMLRYMDVFYENSMTSGSVFIYDEDTDIQCILRDVMEIPAVPSEVEEEGYIMFKIERDEEDVSI